VAHGVKKVGQHWSRMSFHTDRLHTDMSTVSVTECIAVLLTE